MQRNMDHFSEACNKFGLTISTKKTEVMYQPAPQKAYSEPTIRFGNETLKVPDRFCYLGRTLSNLQTLMPKLITALPKPDLPWTSAENVWERRGIKAPTKVKVYRATVIPTLLYACETWTLYERHT